MGVGVAGGGSVGNKVVKEAEGGRRREGGGKG